MCSCFELRDDPDAYFTSSNFILFYSILFKGIEHAVSKAIGSAFSYKGTVFLSYEKDDSPLEVIISELLMINSSRFHFYFYV
jgi:hypothetical protein